MEAEVLLTMQGHAGHGRPQPVTASHGSFVASHGWGHRQAWPVIVGHVWVVKLASRILPGNCSFLQFFDGFSRFFPDFWSFFGVFFGFLPSRTRIWPS